MRAAEHRRGHGRSRAPIALDCGAVLEGITHERLARRPREDRPVERLREFMDMREDTIAVGRAFGKPDSRIDDQAVARDACENRRLDSASEFLHDFLNEMFVM